jgi:endonuclease III related protein
MRQLGSARVLNLPGIRGIPVRRLEQLIRSSGYFRQKATRLKNFVRFLDETHGGSLTKMFAQPTPALRDQLLSLDGVGPETADSILLYAGQHASFVVDAYTKRIAERHGILNAGARQEDVRRVFQGGLAAVELLQESTTGRPGGASHSPSRMSLASRSPLAQVYNEMHGLLVGVGKKYCLKSAPKCEACPLNHLLSAHGRK